MPVRVRNLWFVVALALSLLACSGGGGDGTPQPDPLSFKFEVNPTAETVTLAAVDGLSTLASSLQCDDSSPQSLMPADDLSLAASDISSSFGAEQSLTISASFGNASAHLFENLTFSAKDNSALDSATVPDVVAQLVAGDKSPSLDFALVHKGESFTFEVTAVAVIICDPEPPTDPLSFVFRVDPTAQSVTLASAPAALDTLEISCPITEPQPLTPGEDLTLAADDVSFSFNSDNQLTISTVFANATLHLYENLTLSAKENERLESVSVPGPVARLAGEQRSETLDFNLVHKGQVFFFEVTAMASVTCDTEPPIDPESFQFAVDPIGNSFQFARPGPQAISPEVINCDLDGPQVLTPIVELAVDVTGISFEFLADNVLEFSLPFVNTTDFVFKELSFLFVASDALVQTTTPPALAELGPGETSAPQAFSVTHRGQPFRLQLKVSALVDCEPDPGPVEPPARFGHIMVAFGDTVFLLGGTDEVPGQVSTQDPFFGDLWEFSNDNWEEVDDVDPPADLNFGDGITVGNNIFLASGASSASSNQLNFFNLNPQTMTIESLNYFDDVTPFPPFKGINLVPTGSSNDQFKELIFLNGQTGSSSLDEGLFGAFLIDQEGETKVSTSFGELFDSLFASVDAFVGPLDFDGEHMTAVFGGSLADTNKVNAFESNFASDIFADGFESGDTSAWSTTVPRPQQAGFPHLSSGALVTLGNKMWLFGGVNTDTNTTLDSVIELTFNDPNDFDNVSFRFLDPLPKARRLSEAVILSSNSELRVLIFGGIGSDNTALADTVIYTIPLE